MSCPVQTAESAAGEDCFFCADGIHWDTHRIGWAVAGGCAALTSLITLFSMTMHATHYQQPAAQRQVMRVLLMPPVYAVVSFFSYRYYQSYEYYVLAETAYEAVTLSAFLMLLMELVAMTVSEKDIRIALQEKDKRKLPFPFNFIRFRASKPYFMHALSFSVMQYVVIRPVISIVGIITQYYGVLCPEKYSVHFAEVYLDAVDFVSISVALYGLIVFYVLCKDQLKGRKPLNKFLAIKLIVFFTFYQSFVFSILQNYDVIKGTAYWTADNVSDGLSALCTTVEMVVFSVYMGWAYNWTEYTNPEINPNQRKTGARTYFQAIWDTINLSDFALEIWLAIKFLVAFLKGKPGTHAQPTKMQQSFMPDTITPHEKYPMSRVSGPGGPDQHHQTEKYPPLGPPRRRSSGTLVNSPDYQRLQEEGRSPPSSAQAPYPSSGPVSAASTYDVNGASERQRHPFAYASTPDHRQYPDSPNAAGAWGQSYSANPAQPSSHGFPAPHPTGPAGLGRTPTSGEDHAYTGQQQSGWPSAQQTGGERWPEVRPTGATQSDGPRRESGGWGQAPMWARGVNDGREPDGIPGNPRLY